MGMTTLNDLVSINCEHYDQLLDAAKIGGSLIGKVLRMAHAEGIIDVPIISQTYYSGLKDGGREIILGVPKGITLRCTSKVGSRISAEDFVISGLFFQYDPEIKTHAWFTTIDEGKRRKLIPLILKGRVG